MSPSNSSQGSPVAANLPSVPKRSTLQVGRHEGLWRRGNLLLIHPMAVMPPICVKTGKPGYKSVHKHLRWNYIRFYDNIPLFLLPHFLTRNRRLKPWLCQEAYLTYFWQGATKWVAVALSTVAIFVCLIAISFAESWYGNSDIKNQAVLWLICAVIAWTFFSTSDFSNRYLLIPEVIHPAYALIAGVHENFLARLEEYPEPLPE